MKRHLQRLKALLSGRDRGTVAVTFILSFPVLLLIVAVLVQYALLVNGRIVFQQALTAAARSAMTSLPADPDADDVNGRGNVERATLLALAPLSPPADTVSGEAAAVAQALGGVGVAVPADFARRYTFAQNGTVVRVETLDRNDNTGPAPATFSRVAGGRARITVFYPFRLNVPMANVLVGDKTSIAGAAGRYFTFTGHVDVQLSHGRLVPTNAEGEPTGMGRPE